MKALLKALKDLAVSSGFDRMIVASARPLTVWQSQSGKNPHWDALVHDPFLLLPGARRVILLLRSYRPYLPRPGLVTVSSYYPCSNAAYKNVASFCDLLRQYGFSALCRPNLPYKSMLVASGSAAYGLNSLTARSDMGSRYAVQAILTDAPLETDPISTLDDLWNCEACARCVRSCPVNALENGRVDVNRCLRAIHESAVVSEPLRPFLGNSLLGCDICQDVCPRNHPIESMPMPEALSQALSLEALLTGTVEPLIPFIGANYARKKRIQSRACILTANLMRRDCIQLLNALRDDPYEAVRVHARWAISQLEK